MHKSKKNGSNFQDITCRYFAKSFRLQRTVGPPNKINAVFSAPAAILSFSFGGTYTPEAFL
jgi:hypothetical protein